MLTHTVKSGDTVWQIVKNNGITIDQFKQWNPDIKDLNVIYPGQVVNLSAPSQTGATDNGATEAPTLAPAPTQPTKNNTNYTDTDEGKSKKQNKINAENAVENYGDFNYSKDATFAEIMDKILNREKFSYDFNGDALYQQYKDKYIQQGKMAMQDTIGQASAMTGGYGNSYAQTVGNQAYQASLEKLNDVIPELYQMAYDQYKQEGQDLYNQYAMLSDDKTMEYGMWSDKYNRLVDQREYESSDFYNSANLYNTDRDTANDLAQQNWENEFNTWEANNANAWSEAQWNEGIRQWMEEHDLAERELALKEKEYEDSETTYTGGNDNNNFSYTNENNSDNNSNNNNSNDTKPVETKPKSYSGTSYSEAVAFAEANGVPSSHAAGIMTREEWARRKSSYQLYGQGGTEVTQYNSYKEYLAGITEYLIEKYN